MKLATATTCLTFHWEDFNCPTFGKIIKTSGTVFIVKSVNQDYVHTMDNTVINWLLDLSNNVTPATANLSII